MFQLNIIIMKTNKLIIIAAIFAVIGLNASAQKYGVYKTFADYANGKLEVSIDCGTEKGKIKPNDFFKTDYITVIKNGERIDLKKDEMFGYQLCDGKLSRFLNKEHLSVDEKGILWIYTKEVLQASSPKLSSKWVKKYYFSKGGDGAIKYLTLNNLKAAFPDNHKLHDAIDLQFGSDASIAAYDSSHKMFKINHFLENQGI